MPQMHLRAQFQPIRHREFRTHGRVREPYWVEALPLARTRGKPGVGQEQAAKASVGGLLNRVEGTYLFLSYRLVRFLGCPDRDFQIPQDQKNLCKHLCRIGDPRWLA